jgi:NAD(P)H-dependent flavin oxidoreductase YrpB (nitropropane dioxygenase family)
VRTRSISGKPARLLRNAWTEAWEQPDAPEPLPMPLQGIVSIDMIRRTMRYPDQAQEVAFNPAGQVIGMINQVRSVRSVMSDLIDGYGEAVERLQKMTP